MGTRRRLLAGALSLYLCATSAHGDIYAVRGEDGVVSFTDAPVDPDYRVIIRDAVPEAPREPRWREVARTEALKKRLDPLLVKAMIHVESGARVDAVSSKGAVGLMQLMPGTARAMGVQDPFKPHENIQGGVKYLSEMLNRFGGRLDLALAAYNAGPNAVDRYKGIPPYAETRNYVTKVLDAYRRLSSGMSLDTSKSDMDNPLSFAGRE